MRSSVTNVSWDLLDAAVIGGRGEQPVLEGGARTWTHARLLEEVGALGGLLHHLGVGVGVPVVVALAEEHADEAVAVALATARLGGVVRTDDDPAAPVVVVSSGSPLPGEGRERLVRARAGETVSEPDLDWSVMLRAGRTDPAACAVLEPGAAYSPTRSVAEQRAALAAVPAPHRAEDLRRLLQV